MVPDAGCTAWLDGPAETAGLVRDFRGVSSSARESFAYSGSVAMPDRPPGLLRRWESLSTPVQAAIVFPLLTVVLILVNVGGFNQPVPRSVVYGVIEALPFTALILVATHNERKKRAERDGS